MPFAAVSITQMVLSHFSCHFIKHNPFPGVQSAKVLWVVSLFQTELSTHLSVSL